MQTYSEIIAELTKPFPEGTVVQSGNRHYIPVQVYLKRLEDVAAEHWSWRIVGEPIINTEQMIVILKGEITIISTVRQGVGVARISKLEALSIKNAISTADSEAFRDACDKFMMGWKDLAPFRDWSKNPGIGLANQVVSKEVIPNFDENVHSLLPPSDRTCIRCKKQLSTEEELFLNVHNIKHPYCKEHVPKQFIKNK